jgi:hypothetical protein
MNQSKNDFPLQNQSDAEPGITAREIRLALVEQRDEKIQLDRTAGMGLQSSGRRRNNYSLLPICLKFIK